MHDGYHNLSIGRMSCIYCTVLRTPCVYQRQNHKLENSLVSFWRLSLGKIPIRKVFPKEVFPSETFSIHIKTILLVVLVLSLAKVTAIADTNLANAEQETLTSGAELNVAIEFKEVADGIYVRYGKHEPVSAKHIGNIANHGFIVGETGVAIVDPGGSEDVANSTLSAIAKITQLPVTHIIVTHVHADHSLGLSAYKSTRLSPKPVVLGHNNLEASLSHNLAFYAAQFGYSKHTDKILQLIKSGMIQPVDTERVFNLGSREITVKAFSTAHSTSDVVVYDNKSKTLWAGDLLFVDRIPAIDGSVLGWLAALESLAKLETKIVIPGHGRSGEYDLLMQPQLEYLNLLVSYSREAIANGLSLNTFLQKNNGVFSADKADQWELFDTQHKVNLTRAYTELEWE